MDPRAAKFAWLFLLLMATRKHVTDSTPRLQTKLHCRSSIWHIQSMSPLRTSSAYWSTTRYPMAL